MSVGTILRVVMFLLSAQERQKQSVHMPGIGALFCRIQKARCFRNARTEIMFAFQ